MFTISLTGHRPADILPKLGSMAYNLNHPFWLELKRILKAVIEKQIENHGQVTCRSGMALGADTIWALAILDVKNENPDKVTFIADIPDMNQAGYWNKQSKDLWQSLLDQADQVVTYDHIEHKSYPHLLNIRNGGLIDNADMVLSVWNGKTHGGTYNATKEANRKGKMVVHINPKDIKY